MPFVFREFYTIPVKQETVSRQQDASLHILVNRQMPIRFQRIKYNVNRKSASRQFTRMCESASGCRLQSSYSTSIVFSSLKSNGHLAASCQLPIHTNRRISIWLPFAGFLSSFYCLNPLKSNWHLAASCKLPIHTNRRISIWLPFAGFLSSFYCFKPFQIELASGCQLPVASCQFTQTGELASGCRLPVSYLAFCCFKPSQIELASGCQLPVVNSNKQAN